MPVSPRARERNALERRLEDVRLQASIAECKTALLGRSGENEAELRVLLASLAYEEKSILSRLEYLR